jgi:hypothetical protein
MMNNRSWTARLIFSRRMLLLTVAALPMAVAFGQKPSETIAQTPPADSPSTSVAAGPSFIARLPQGTVELVGITNYPPTNKSPWWQPDGSPLQIGPFLPQEKYHPRVSKHHLPTRAYTFLIRVQDPAADPSAPARSRHLPSDGSATRPVENRPSNQGWPVWKIFPWDSLGNLANNPNLSHLKVGIHAWWWGDTRVVDAGENIVPDYYMYHAGISPSAQVSDLGVGLGTGEWETVITQMPDRVGTQTFNRDGKRLTVTFRRAFADGANLTKVGYKTPLLRQYDFYGTMAKRLVAAAQDGTVVDDGSKHKELDAGSEAVASHCLPLSSIKEYRFQVRPYYWVGFKNVSLQPGQKTDVKVVSPYDP